MDKKSEREGKMDRGNAKKKRKSKKGNKNGEK